MKKIIVFMCALLPAAYTFAETAEEQTNGAIKSLGSLVLFFKIIYYSLFLLLPLGILILLNIYRNIRKKNKLNKIQLVFGIIITVFGSFIYVKMNPFRVQPKVTSTNEKKEEPPSYEQVLKKLNSDEYESLGFLPYNDTNRFCDKLDHKETWNVMQYWESSEGGVHLIDMNIDSIQEFKYLTKASLEEKFDVFNFNNSDVNYILPAHQSYIKSLKKNDFVYTSWRSILATKDKCLQVLMEIRNPTVSEVGQNINRGPIDEITPRNFFKELDYNLVVKNLTETTFDTTISVLFEPLRNCNDVNKNKIQWTLLTNFSFRQDGISLVDMIDNSVFYFSYLRDSSQYLSEKDTSLVPYSLFQSLIGFHYEDELYVSWKDVLADNKCIHIIHEIRMPRNEETTEYAAMKKHKD